MPHYFFQRPGDPRAAGSNGVELPDDASAQDEAIGALGTMLSERPRLLAGDDGYSLRVTDSDGRAVCIVTAKVSGARLLA